VYGQQSVPVPSGHPETFAQGAHARVTELPAGRILQDQLFQRLLGERIIFIGQEIDDELANRVCAQLLLLSAQDGRRDITLYVNSPGGVVDAGMAIYDVMQYLPNDIATVALGLAASMGQSLLCAGTTGKRHALRHARVMMHQPSGGIRGSASDIKIQAEQSLYLKRTLAERTAFHTGRPVEEIERDSDRDRWFTAEEARDYGFVDHVIDSTERVGR
jgi:ATP-dependent Clp protease protease subunit